MREYKVMEFKVMELLSYPYLIFYIFYHIYYTYAHTYGYISTYGIRTLAENIITAACTCITWVSQNL